MEVQLHVDGTLRQFIGERQGGGDRGVTGVGQAQRLDRLGTMGGVQAETGRRLGLNGRLCQCIGGQRVGRGGAAAPAPVSLQPASYFPLKITDEDFAKYSNHQVTILIDLIWNPSVKYQRSYHGCRRCASFQLRRLITKSQKNNSKVMIMQQVLVERIKLPRIKLEMMLKKPCCCACKKIPEGRLQEAEATTLRQDISSPMICNKHFNIQIPSSQNLSLNNLWLCKLASAKSACF